MAPRGTFSDVLDDDPLSSNVARNYLLPMASMDDQHEQQKGESAMMPRATSMLEMNVIHDMVQFEEAMDALSGEPEGASEFFIDSSDHQVEEEDADYDKFLHLSSSPDSVVQVPLAFAAKDSSSGGGGGMRRVMSSSPDSVVHVPQVAARKPSFGGGMRRVMSAASLSSARKFSLSSMVAISEEGDHHNGDDNPKKNNAIDIIGKPDSPGVTIDGSSSQTIAIDSTPDSSSLTNRRPSRRSSPFTITGMPLRSSLKNSTNSLRSCLTSNPSSNNLRSSICSSNMDDTNHSIDSDDDDSSDNNSSLPSSNSMKRNVSFSSLEIRSYNITLGDAPTSNGPPVSLDWEYDPSATTQHEIDHYENYRTKQAPRRNQSEMRMPPIHRQYLLMREAGCTKKEIKEAMEEAKRVAKQRQKTIQGVKLGFVQPVEEVLEKTKRKIFGKRR